MAEENVRRMWSDDELDRALATLHSDVDADERALAAARTGLLAVPSSVDSRRRRRVPHWVVAAAAVAALLAGVLVVRTGQSGWRTPDQAVPGNAVDGGAPNVVALSASGKALYEAADKIGASDQPLGPNQYRYIATHVWWMSTTQGTTTPRFFSYLAENLLETWVPADQSREWLLRRDVTGARKWVQGTEQEARAAGVPVDAAGWPEGEQTARCGDFYLGEGERPCTRSGTWAMPTPEWLAGLPRDPQRLHDRLKADAPGAKLGDVEMLLRAAEALRTGLVPADLRAALYRALAKLPGLEITDQVANLDGRTGTAYGMTDGELRYEIIVDQRTGAFIGERKTVAKDGYNVIEDGSAGIKAGTVIDYSSVTTAVVDAIGVRPAG